MMLAWVLFACGDAQESDDDASSCGLGDQVVLVDIDGTLTPGEEDLGALFRDPPEAPPLRAGAVDLLKGYRSRGVRPVYASVQGQGVLTGDGSDLSVAIAGWFRRAGLPLQQGDLLLAEDLGANRPEDVRAFKRDALAAAGERGTVFWAYGNDSLDAEVWAEVPRAFVIGGSLPEAEAFVAHAETHLPGVPDSCR